jgi:hypothetical protein
MLLPACLFLLHPRGQTALLGDILENARGKPSLAITLNPLACALFDPGVR